MSAPRKSVALYDERGARLWRQAEKKVREEIPAGGADLREGEVLTWILAKQLGLTPLACRSNESPQIYHTKECHQAVDVHIKIQEHLHSFRECGYCREYRFPDKIQGLAVDDDGEIVDSVAELEGVVE